MTAFAILAMFFMNVEISTSACFQGVPKNTIIFADIIIIYDLQCQFTKGKLEIIGEENTFKW